jgi:hypothetical protein
LDLKPPEALVAAATLAMALYTSAVATKPGVVLYKPLIHFQPGESRRPDLAFFAFDLKNAKKLKAYLESPSNELVLIPNIAIEMITPAITVNFIEERTFRYLHAGVQLVWRVLYEAKRIQVFDSPKGFSVLDEEDTLNGGKVLPDFSVKVADLFKPPISDQYSVSARE